MREAGIYLFTFRKQAGVFHEEEDINFECEDDFAGACTGFTFDDFHTMLQAAMDLDSYESLNVHANRLR